MSDSRASLAKIAAELRRLEAEAKVAGEPMLAYLIQLARIEADKASGRR